MFNVYVYYTDQGSEVRLMGNNRGFYEDQSDLLEDICNMFLDGDLLYMTKEEVENEIIDENKHTLLDLLMNIKCETSESFKKNDDDNFYKSLEDIYIQEGSDLYIVNLNKKQTEEMGSNTSLLDVFYHIFNNIM